MADGAFVRLNGSMVQGSSMGDGQIISVIGRMESTNGANMVVSASDGVPLTYSMPTEIDFSQGKIVEIMGAKNDGGGLDAFVTREISEDFDLDLYNEFLTKVLHSNTGRFQGYFVAK